VLNDTLALSFIPKRHEHKQNSISMLAYREKTLKVQGVNHPADSDLKKFDALKKEKNEVLSELAKSDAPTTAPTTSMEQFKTCRLRSELKARLANIRGEASNIMKRNRTIRNNWTTNIVGVEQIGDDAHSELFGEQQKQLERLERRHSETHKNRL
jgi:hypothetical protein